MAKTKVYELAKEYSLSSTAMLRMLGSMGYKLKSHMSTVDDKMREEISKKFKSKREEVKQEYERKSKLVLNHKVNDDLVVAGEERIKKQVTGTFTNFEALAGRTKKKKKKKRRQGAVDQSKVKENVRKTLAKIGTGEKIRKRYKRGASKEEGESSEEKNKLLVSEFVSVAELAKMMEHSASEVMTKCLELGLMITINQRLDFDTIALIADEFGFEAELMKEYLEEAVSKHIEEYDPKDLVPRPPVVTVMGHVDHGKTSLLDYIRKTNVISGEAGGITQHIGAYVVNTKRGKVTFLDTPGHEAFTAMRARGARATDVVVLVIAADSGVMPQTVEAIDHAKAAGVPLVIAINKIDLPNADINKVKRQLADNNVLLEEIGGNVQAVPVSASTGENVDKLLELLALETEMLELKANPKALATGVIVEAELNKGMGPVATVLVQDGTLKVGDAFVVGVYSGRVRTMLDESGKHVDKASPSVPVIVMGLEGVPRAGDNLIVMEHEKEAKGVASKRRQAKHESDIRRISVTLDNWSSRVSEGKKSELLLLIKGDVDGSVEVLSSQIENVSTDEVRVRVIHKSVGAIKITDIDLAAASKAIVIGFHVRPNSKIRGYAEKEGVEIRTYRVIYEAVEDMKKAMSGLLAPLEKEKILGRAEIREIFRISRIGNIAGCSVQSGVMRRGARSRIIRDDVEIADTKIGSLKRVKDDVREVAMGYECGIILENFNDIKPGDIIENYEIEKIARTL